MIRAEIVAEVLPRNELVAFEVFSQNCREDRFAWSCAPRHFPHLIRADWLLAWDPPQEAEKPLIALSEELRPLSLSRLGLEDQEISKPVATGSAGSRSGRYLVRGTRST